jgi:HEAT repeat protein
MIAFALALLFGLQDDADVPAAIEKFKASMKSSSAATRAEAVTELGKTPHAKTMALIVPLLQADLPPVRASAAKALGKFPDQKKVALPALQHALAANSELAVLAAIFDALGELGDASAMAAVQKYFYDKDLRTVRHAVGVAGTLPHAASVDPLIDVQRRQEKYVKANSGGSTLAGGDANGNNKIVAKPDEAALKNATDLIADIDKALSKITSESFSGSQQWQAWWNQAKPTFKIQK